MSTHSVLSSAAPPPAGWPSGGRGPSALRRLALAALAAAVVLVAGCDSLGTDEADERSVVVESYQTAGEPLAPVRLSRSTPLDSTYSFEGLAVRNADVAVELLAEDGSVEERYPYAPDPDSNGFYRPEAQLNRSAPADQLPTVQPLRTYRLVADIPQGETLRATTTVPDTFSVVRANRDTSTYQSGPQIELTITRSQVRGLDQSYFIFSTRSLEPTEENLTPVVEDFVSGSDDFTLKDVEQTASPIINEEGYEVNDDGTLTISLPWVAVAFYGPNETTASVLDPNLYDFIRSQSVQQGGGGLSPGAIPSIIERVENGTGVFGSRASVSYRVYVDRP
jgi:hypothetical protein